MSEDEQLQAAMRASLEDSGAGGGDATAEYDYEMNSDEDNDVVIVDSAGHKVEDDSKPKAIEKKEEATAAAAPPAPQAPASMLDELIPFDIGDEPEKGARIQFRMPDGKRKIRKFDPSQSVKHVYAFVAVSDVEDLVNKCFFRGHRLFVCLALVDDDSVLAYYGNVTACFDDCGCVLTNK